MPIFTNLAYNLLSAKKNADEMACLDTLFFMLTKSR